MAFALLEGGANPRCKDASGRTLFHLAAGPDRFERPQVFLNRFLSYEAAKRLPRLLGMFANAGVDINAPDREGATPLDYALKAHGADSIIANIFRHAGAKPSRTLSRGRPGMR